MLVALPNGTALRGDAMLKAVQRFDLTAVPSTLEVALRVDASMDASIAAGQQLVAGEAEDRYRIVKVTRVPNTQDESGNAPELVHCIAVLEPFYALAQPMPRAVVKERRSMGEVYRACGATPRVADDIPTERFTCFVGQFPTEGIQQLLQEEAAGPVWAGGRVSFKRLPDLFKGRPIDSLPVDTTRAVESPFLEQHQVPTAMSTDAVGSVVLGRTTIPRGTVYLPRMPARVLNNMATCLVVRRTLVGAFAGHIRAGDGFDVAGVRHVVVTAAHSWETGSGGQGANQVTRLWLGELLR